MSLQQKLKSLYDAPREHLKRPTVIHVDEQIVKQAITKLDELEACLRGVRQAICEQSPVVIWYGPLGVTAFDEITSLLGDGESPEVDALINKSGE